MVRHVNARVAGLDPRLAGVRIAHLSDIHVSALAQPRLLWRALDHVARSGAEIALLTGDYVCASLRALPKLTAALKALSMPSVATLGNHDHWAGAAEVAAALTAAGVRVLQNQHVTLEIRGAPLHVIGLDDGATRHADAERAFQGVPERGLRVALTHDPRQADRVAPRGAHLILAGHTHGGQVDVPGLTKRLMRRRGFQYVGGEYRLGNALLYVNRGLGATIPVRLRVPSELALLTLSPV